MALPVISGRKIVKILEKVGFSVVGQKGSHVRLKKASDRVYIVVVPLHREVAPGTLKSILRQAGLSREEFLSLIKK